MVAVESDQQSREQETVQQAFAAGRDQNVIEPLLECVAFRFDETATA